MRGFVKVTFQPVGQSVHVPIGETVLAAAREAGLGIHTPCGGRGTCGTCRITFVNASPLQPPEPTAEEVALLSSSELASGMRLACRAHVGQDAVITIPEATIRKDSKFLLDGVTRDVPLAPAIEKTSLEVPKATLENQRADADLLVEALSGSGRQVRLTHGALTTLPTALRDEDHRVTAVMHAASVLAVEPGDTTESLYAVAFDVGTTTVVGMLLDLRTGGQIAVAARTNPQVSYGDDVVSRISFAGDGGLDTLTRAIVECINEIINEIAAEAGVAKDSIYEAVFCGNTTMGHILLGLDPSFVAQSPYVPVVRGSVETTPTALSVDINPRGRIVVLPNVAGFIGGDTIGVMLAADFAHDERLRLAIDIGTNGEIVLGGRGRIICASAAAGPAFEGARIRHGMRAAPGAIEKVWIESGHLVLSTIDDAPAVGICGTGLIDAVAVLLDAGLVDETGRLLSADEADAGGASDDLKMRLIENSTGPVFVLADTERDKAAREIHLSQRDIRELQLAKGAIQAAVTILMKEYGIEARELDEVLLAGAFGNYIREESALRIGLLPDVPTERITQIGNAAGTGAKLVALDSGMLEEAENLSLSAGYVELAGRADFQMIFAESMMFS